jgi:hypothetical protein
MKIKCFIIILVFTIGIWFQTLAQKCIVNNDSTKTTFLSFRIAGGVSKFYFLNINHRHDSDNITYELSDIDAYPSQLGLKLTSTAKENTAFTMELNYVIAQYYLIYNGCDCGQGGGTGYNANYKATIHSAQLAILPKITIGKKKKMYTSFGPYVSAPFYHNTRGIYTTSTYGFYSSSSSTSYNNNHIKTPLMDVFGAIINLGANYPLKKNMLSFELRFQANLISTIRSNTVLLSAIYTLDSRPIHYTFWTD